MSDESDRTDPIVVWLDRIWRPRPGLLQERLHERSPEVLEALETVLNADLVAGYELLSLTKTVIVFRLLHVYGADLPERLDTRLKHAAIAVSWSAGPLLWVLRCDLEALPKGRGAEARELLRQYVLAAAESEWVREHAEARGFVAGVLREALEHRLDAGGGHRDRMPDWPSWRLTRILRGYGAPPEPVERQGRLLVWDLLRMRAAHTRLSPELQAALQELPAERLEAALLEAGSPWEAMHLAPTPVVLRRALDSITPQAHGLAAAWWAFRRLGAASVEPLLEWLPQAPAVLAPGGAQVLVEVLPGTPERLIDLLPELEAPEVWSVLAWRVAEHTGEATQAALLRRWARASASGRLPLAVVVALLAARGELGEEVLAALEGDVTAEAAALLSKAAAAVAELGERSEQNISANPLQRCEEAVRVARAALLQGSRAEAGRWWAALDLAQAKELAPRQALAFAVEPGTAICALAGVEWGSPATRAAQLARLERLLGRRALALAGAAVLGGGELVERLGPLYAWVSQRGAAPLALHLEALGSGKPALSAMAARALAGFGEEAVAPVVALLSASSPPTRTAAARALGALRSPAALGPLRAALAAEWSSAVRQELQSAIGALGAQALSASEVGLWEGPEDYELRRAMAALRGILGEAEGTTPSWLHLCDLLQRMVDHGHGEVAVEYVVAHGLERWRPALRARPKLWAQLPALAPVLELAGQAGGEVEVLVAQLHSEALRAAAHERLLALTEEGRRRQADGDTLLEERLERFCRAVYFGWRWCAAHHVPVDRLEVRVDGGKTERDQRETPFVELSKGFLVTAGQFPLLRLGAIGRTAAGVRVLGVRLPPGHFLEPRVGSQGLVDLREEFAFV